MCVDQSNAALASDLRCTSTEPVRAPLKSGIAGYPQRTFPRLNIAATANQFLALNAPGKLSATRKMERIIPHRTHPL